MKKSIIYAIGALMMFATSSCGESYLDLRPESSTTQMDLFSTPTTAQYAVNGIARLMQTQYWSSQGYNGEGTVFLYCIEMPGEDCSLPNNTGWSNTMSFNYFDRNNSNQMIFPWYYYYKLIGNANIIDINLNTKTYPDLDPKFNSAEYQYVLAQALCYRAYSYLRLTQFYCRRWADLKGECRGLPLRLDDSNDPLAASSLKHVYEQIYKDLDQAIEIFNTCGIKGNQTWKPSLEVAHAIYSRAALNRQDWSNVVSHSQEARKGHPLMGDAEYHKGFYQVNNEWIWSAFSDETQNIYYYSYFAYCGSNANTSYCRSYGWIVDRLLYESIPDTDSRKDLTMAPTEAELNALADPYSNNNYQEVTSSKNKAYYTRIKRDYADKLYSTTKLYYYSQAKVRIEQGAAYGVGEICLFRSAEMLYNEAEAQYQLGNFSAAKSLLEEAVHPYDASYTAPASGTELWNEIVKYRRFDLILEGHSFLDEKRWNQDHDKRVLWEDGGNWTVATASKGGGVFGVHDKNNWTIVYPQSETLYNDLVTTFEPEGWTEPENLRHE